MAGLWAAGAKGLIEFGIRGRDGSLRDCGRRSVTAETAGGTSMEWNVRMVMRVVKKARRAKRTWNRRGGIWRVMGRPQHVLWAGMIAVAREGMWFAIIAGGSLFARLDGRKEWMSRVVVCSWSRRNFATEVRIWDIGVSRNIPRYVYHRILPLSSDIDIQLQDQIMNPRFIQSYMVVLHSAHQTG